MNFHIYKILHMINLISDSILKQIDSDSSVNKNYSFFISYESYL